MRRAGTLFAALIVIGVALALWSRQKENEEAIALSPPPPPKVASTPITVPVASASPEKEQFPLAQQQPNAQTGNGVPVIPVLDQKQFAKKASRILEDLPTLKELRRLKEEDLHRTPDMIREAGAKLGELAQLLHEHPELEPEAFAFYDRCALRADLPVSIRALCFSNLKRVGGHLGKAVDSSRFPAQILELARQVSS